MIRRTLLLSLFAISYLSLPSFAQRQHTFTAPSPASPTAPPVAPPDKARTRTEWSFLPLSATHADQFIADHPRYDGRGVLVFIFDTGVDPGISGLLTTTEEKRKIIDVRDYSGTGDVPYVLAERAGDELRVGGKTVLHGLNAIGVKPADGRYYYGALNEKRFQNGLHDLNFNSNDNDVFGVLVYQDSTNHYAAYVDSDGDRDLSDEHSVTNYHEHFDTFAFHSLDTSEGRRLTGAVNIFPDRQVISIYFDDGSHGTHVAGIASGYNIDNEPGFNGVAPGAQIIAIKFADNNAGGVTVSGSMQRAFEYAAAMADSQSKPVVVNMSFGIGNELEGHAAMDKWLDSLLTATPNLTVCVAAGNDGPGLSSIGLPGSASQLISCGAALPDEAARDLYGTYTTHSLIFDFSSRGGELAKPDLVCPGTAVSTVPDYVESDRYNGTSMATPYTAGCAALLLSAMTQEFPSWTVNAYEIKRAMMLSADHVDGATPLDEGGGMVDVPAAFELLSHWQRSGHVPVPVSIETAIPSSTRTGTAAYFRAGNYPSEGENETFTIDLSEPAGASARARAIGMQAFDLVSDAPWMSPLESSIYRRGSGTMSVAVRYHPKLLQKPGLYSGRIWAYEKGAQHTRANAQFELVNSIVIPHTFSDENKYQVSLADLNLAPGTLDREFFAIPPGAKSVKLTISTRDAKRECSVSLFDNNGEEFSHFGTDATKHTSSVFISGSQVTPGIWEADLSRTMSPEDAGPVSLDFTVQVQPLEIDNVAANISTNGNPEIRATLSNPSLLDYQVRASGVVSGYERTIDTVLTTADEFTLPFTPREGERGVLFQISLPPEDYNLFTDIACQVLRPDSNAVFNSAFDYSSKIVPVIFESQGSEETSASDRIAAKYVLHIRGGLALPDRAHPWHLHIVEERYVQHGAYLTANPEQVLLSPFQSQNMHFNADNPAQRIPEGYRLFGSIELRQGDDEIVKIPVRW